jgi:hypothetical protein
MRDISSLKTLEIQLALLKDFLRVSGEEERLRAVKCVSNRLSKSRPLLEVAALESSTRLTRCRSRE